MRNILDLKKNPDFLPQYVELRNSYCELLLTHPVILSETIQWLKWTTAEIHLIEEENCLLGVLLLYIDRNGEVALFTRKHNAGIGKNLLRVADNIALSFSLPSIWSWIRADNYKAVHVFEKSGYCFVKREDRIYDNKVISGIKYTKKLLGEPNV